MNSEKTAQEKYAEKTNMLRRGFEKVKGFLSKSKSVSDIPEDELMRIQQEIAAEQHGSNTLGKTKNDLKEPGVNTTKVKRFLRQHPLITGAAGVGAGAVGTKIITDRQE